MTIKNEILETLASLREESRYRTLVRSGGLSFVHNDYLGLSTHPCLIEAGKWALDICGAGSRGSRLLGGHSGIFEEVEEALAKFFGAPSALFFSTGYLANLSVVGALAPYFDRLISDERIHASLIDAIALSRKPKVIIPHNRWDTVPTDAANAKSLVITESLFSMDGDFVDGDRLRAFLETAGSYLILDEAHAAGVFPKNGAGLHQELGMGWDRLAVVVTFGKAFGVAGAAVLCSPEVRELMINSSRPFIYTTAPSPVVVAMVGAAVEVLTQEPWRREELWERARMVRNVLSEAGMGGDGPLPQPQSEREWQSPIVPFLVRDRDRALRFAESMREIGVELRAIRYPTVPRGEERAANFA